MNNYRTQAALGFVLLIFVTLAVLASSFEHFGWDLGLTLQVQSITLPGFKTAMTWISWIGTRWMPWILIMCTGLALILGRLRLEGILLMAGVSLGAVFNFVLKSIIQRPRPSSDLIQVLIAYPNDSFPSGHVLFYMQYFGFLFFLSWTLWRRSHWRDVCLGGLALPIVLGGLSRVYLGAHWPSDVVEAYVLGALWLMLMIQGHRRWSGTS